MYVIQFKSFKFKEFANKIYNLQKPIYELKQALKSWNIHFDEIIKHFDFIKNIDESCVYKKVSGSEVVFMKTTYYQQEMIFFLLQLVKIWLSKNFFIKDMREITYILKIKI